MQRAVEVARKDERIRALMLWGSLARGDADEWTGVEYIASVSDESVSDVLDELSQKDSPYGRSLVSLRMPQNGVEDGGFISVTYLQSGLPLHVDWYICPFSLGFPVQDTKPLFAREGWPESGMSFAELLRNRPSRKSCVPTDSDLLATMIPINVAEVARGRPEAVLVDGKPANDRIDAYDELSRRIAELHAANSSEIQPAFFYHLGIARRGR